MSNKVAVIGLDGMAWHLLNKLFEYNAMPVLKRITENSLRGILESTIPPLTPPAWTSIASGVNPGKHGVFDFIRFTKNYETRIVTSHNVSYPRIHEMVALKGLKSVCINQPLTYPLIKQKNSIIISDWLGPRVCCHPKSLERYKQQYVPYESVVKAFFNKHQYLSRLHENTIKRVDTVNRMMQQLDWDLFWVIYTEPDLIFHRFYENVLSGQENILRIFEKLDETIEIASELSDLIVIVSDHGFLKYKFAIYPNCFLDHLGLISKMHKKAPMRIADFIGNEEQYKRPFKLPKNIQIFLFMEPIRTIVKKIYNMVTGKNVHVQVPYADPKNSKAFLMAYQGIHVKEKALIEIIENRLRKLKGIHQVWTIEKIYTGPYADKAPHILFTYDKGYVTGSPRVVGKIIYKRITYYHHPDGIIIFYGRRVKPQQIGRINTYDVVPTILNYVGLPIPNDTDGKCIIGVPAKEVRQKTYNYLDHWRLNKKIHSVKRKLTKL